MVTAPEMESTTPPKTGPVDRLRLYLKPPETDGAVDMPEASAVKATPTATTTTKADTAVAPDSPAETAVKKPRPRPTTGRRTQK
jgi:hypothetical protein